MGFFKRQNKMGAECTICCDSCKYKRKAKGKKCEEKSIYDFDFSARKHDNLRLLRNDYFNRYLFKGMPQNVRLTQNYAGLLVNTPYHSFDIEEQVFCKGVTMLFYDDVIGFVATNQNFTTIGTRSLNNRPYLYSFNFLGYKFTKTVDELVFVYNSHFEHDIPSLTLDKFADRLTAIQCVKENNLNMQKASFVIQFNDKEQNVEDVLEELRLITGSKPMYIRGTDGANDYGIDPTKRYNVINFNVPYIASQIYQLETNLRNEIKDYLGMPHLGIDRLERATNSAVEYGASGSLIANNSGFVMRQNAVNRFNELYGDKMRLSVEDLANAAVRGF